MRKKKKKRRKKTIKKSGRRGRGTTSAIKKSFAVLTA